MLLHFTEQELEDMVLVFRLFLTRLKGDDRRLRLRKEKNNQHDWRAAWRHRRQLEKLTKGVLEIVKRAQRFPVEEHSSTPIMDMIHDLDACEVLCRDLAQAFGPISIDNTAIVALADILFALKMRLCAYRPSKLMQSCQSAN